MTSHALATEMTNKIRWAIGSTLDGEEGNGRSSLPYREQMWLASLLTDDILSVLAAREQALTHNGSSPQMSRTLLKSLLTQKYVSD